MIVMKKWDNIFTRLALLLFLFPIVGFIGHSIMSFAISLLQDTIFSFLIWPIFGLVMIPSVCIVLWPIQKYLHQF